MVDTELGLRLGDESRLDPAAAHPVYWCLGSESELLSPVQRGVYHPPCAAVVAFPQSHQTPDPVEMSFRVSEDVDTRHSTKPVPCQSECLEPLPSQH